MQHKLITAVSLTLAALFALSDGANAISRYNSTAMSCNSARAKVAAEGAVIFRWPSSRKPSLTLYDRFVAHSGFCRINEYAAPKSVPTSDRNACRLYHCRDIPDMDRHPWNN